MHPVANRACRRARYRRCESFTIRHMSRVGARNPILHQRRACGTPDSEWTNDMVTIEYIGRSATNAYRAKGTAIARATLLHLGMPLPPIMDRHRRPRVPRTGTLLMECFANESSPMQLDTM